MGLCSKLAKWVCACGSLVCQFGTVVIKFAKTVVWICAVHCRRSALVEFATLHTWFCYEASACLLLPICKTNVSLCLHKGVLASIANLVCMFVKSVCVAQFLGNKACFIFLENKIKRRRKFGLQTLQNFVSVCPQLCNLLLFSFIEHYSKLANLSCSLERLCCKLGECRLQMCNNARKFFCFCKCRKPKKCVCKYANLVHNVHISMKH